MQHASSTAVDVAILAEGVGINRAYLSATEGGILATSEERPPERAEDTSFAWPRCKFELCNRLAPEPDPDTQGSCKLHACLPWSAASRGAYEGVNILRRWLESLSWPALHIAGPGQQRPPHGDHAAPLGEQLRAAAPDRLCLPGPAEQRQGLRTAGLSAGAACTAGRSSWPAATTAWWSCSGPAPGQAATRSCT